QTNLAGHFWRRVGLHAGPELVILQRQDLRVRDREGEVIRPDALADEELGRHRAQPVAGRIAQDLLPAHLCAPIKAERDGLPVAIAQTHQTALAAVDPAVLSGPAVAREMEDG